MNQDANNKSSAIIIGLIIIVVGLILLMNVLSKGSTADIIMAKYWPILILLFGAIMAAASPRVGLATMFFGALLLIYQLGLFGTSSGRAIVVVLIMLSGLVLIVSTIGPKKKASGDLPPPRVK